MPRRGHGQAPEQARMALWAAPGGRKVSIPPGAPYRSARRPWSALADVRQGRHPARATATRSATPGARPTTRATIAARQAPASRPPGREGHVYLPAPVQPLNCRPARQRGRQAAPCSRRPGASPIPLRMPPTLGDRTIDEVFQLATQAAPAPPSKGRRAKRAAAGRRPAGDQSREARP